MHDIGKGVIPLGILNKAGALDAREMAIMRGHAAAGHDLLMVRGDAVDQHEPMTLDVVRHHHEALDGTGYPDCLAGAAIADPVRIVTICDVFTALIEDRPYKSALAGHEAFPDHAGHAWQVRQPPAGDVQPGSFDRSPR